MELIKAGENTYYFEGPTKIGVYRFSDDSVCLIDSGNDDRAGKKVLKALDENGMSVRMIINTHSHADHIGGNAVIQKATGCKIYAAKEALALIECPRLEPSLAYGGYPCKDICHKFLVAQASVATDVSELPECAMKIIPLKGHSWDMLGVMTPDGVLFAGDAILGEETIDKYGVYYIFDVENYLLSLETLENSGAKLIVMSHGSARGDIKPLADKNRKQIDEIIALLLTLCKHSASHDEIIKAVFDKYNIRMNFTQNILIGTVLRSYLGYLFDRDMVEVDFSDNIMKWKTL